MEQIYERSYDLHVKTKLAYVSGTELWGAADYPVPLKTEEVVDAFKKGMLLLADNGSYVRPDAVNSDNEIVVGGSEYIVRSAAVAAAAEQQNTSVFGILVSTIQKSDVAVDGNAFEGTLKYLDDDGALAGYWGPGNFLVVKFTAPVSATSVKVGLYPHWEEGENKLAYNDGGLVELVGDPDQNGAFKITDKNVQVLKIVSTDGTSVVTDIYDLSGLTLEGPND